MSETTETTAEPAAEPLDQTPEATPAPEQTAAPEDTPEPAPKPKRTERHVAQLTARISTLEQEMQAAQRRAETAEALLAARGEGEDDTPARDDQGRFTARPEPVDREAIRREVEFDAKRASLIEAGVKEFTKEAWDEKTGILHNLGATRSPAFLEALVDLPNATRIVSELADDPDTLVGLLRKTPAAMAAHLGRMDAKMEQPTAKANVSAAPTPPKRLDSSTVVAEPDIADPNMSMAEWMRLMDKREAARRAERRR